MNPSVRRARLLACAALSLPALLLCGPALLPGRELQGRDFQSGYGPLYEFARRSWRETGELPRWNPGLYAGIPFWGNPQTDLLYPPNWLFLGMPSGTAFGILAFLHLLAAAAGTYRLGRGLKLGRAAAVLAGVSYAASFALVGRLYAGHYPYLVTLCLAPLLLHLVRLVIDRPSPRHAAGLAAGVAAVLLGGSPQFILQLSLLAAPFAAWRLAVRRRAGADWKAPAIGLAAAAGTGLLLAMAHLLPALEMAGESSRAAGDVRGLADPFGDFTPASLVALIVPRFHWHAESDLWLWHEKAVYVGILPLLLAGAAVGLSRGGPVRFFAIVLLLAVLAAAGGATPVHRALGLLPTYARYRVPERILWMASLSLSILAGLGWELLSTAAPESRRRVLAAAGLLGAALSVALLAGQRAPREAALFAAACGAAVVAIHLGARLPAGPVLAVALVAFDLGGHGLATLEFRSGDPSSEPTWVEAAIGPELPGYRVLDLTGTDARAMVRGARLLRSGGYPIPARLAEFFGRAWQDPEPSLETLPTGGVLKDVSILRRLNVRWIVSAGPALHPDWKVVVRRGGTTLYEDPGAQPDCALVGAAGSVTLSRPSPHRILFTVDAAGPARLVTGEAWSAGWRASLDGVELPPRSADGVLIEVEVPAGRSTIDCTFTPQTWRAGWKLSALGLAALAGISTIPLWRRRFGRALDNRGGAP